MNVTNKGLMFLATEPETKIAVALGMTLRGISFRRQENDWRMVIAVTDSKGNHLVAFIQTPNIYDCWWYLNEHMHKTNAPLKWRADKYAK